MPPVTVTPANITSAAVIAQFCILAIVGLGWLGIRRDHRFASLFRERPSYIQQGVILLIFAFLTLGLLLFSDAFSNSWLPLFGRVSFLGLNWSRSMLWLFSLDIIFVSVLVFTTGGSQDSPFNSLFFLLPAIALFLREPSDRIVSYVVAVCLAFTACLPKTPHDDEEEEDSLRRKTAYGLVTLATFAVATLIGYITRVR
jgi:hypothetical protein